MGKHNLLKVILLISLMLVSFGEINAGDFELILAVSESEVSKDSHSADYSVIIEDNVFTFTKKFSGYGAQDPEKVVCSLSDIELSLIYDFIKDLDLLKSDTTTNDKNVVGMYFYCQLHIRDSFGSYAIYINGAEAHFDNEELVKNVKYLLAELQKLAKKC